MTINNTIPKLIALLLVSIVVAFIAISADSSILAKIDSMTATEYIQSQRKLYHHSFIHHFTVWVIVGGMYVVSVEFIAYVVGLCFKKKPAA
jgi:ABC-type amino acid transport system permease subunit